MDSGRSHRVSTGSVRQVARSCTRRALTAWRLGRALRRWPECGLSRPLGVSLSYELLLTRRALSLRSLLRWSPDPDRLVGNAVTFKSRYCTSCESKPLGNGDAVLPRRTPVPRSRTHVSSRKSACEDIHTYAATHLRYSESKGADGSASPIGGRGRQPRRD